jgi:5-methyltetrahydrofolate--homocysteine methyltransferase
MSSFLNNFKDKILLIDGAMGTEIQKRIDNPGINPELLNITSPHIIRSIHKDYALAGAHIITANTFGANRYKLKNSGYSVEDVIVKGIELTKGFEGCYSALDIGPIGVMLKNNTEYDFEYFYSAFKEQVLAGVKAGCDIVLIETMTDIYEAKAAILAVKENSDLPVFCTMTLQENGRTLTGTDVLTIVSILESLGVDALGLNCSFGPEEMIPFVEELVKYSSINVAIQPNAGLPKIVDDKTVFDLSPSSFSDTILKIVSAGVNIVGGCCGTSPEHIAELKKCICNQKSSPVIDKGYTFVSSSTKTVIFNDIKIIGERINPTGKKKLKEAIKNGDMDYIVNLAVQQDKEGADILDVNAGVPGIDEADSIIAMINEISNHTSLPIQIDSSDEKVIEKALRLYNGKALVNSVNGKEESLNKILPLVKKFGCCIVGLTMDDNGIPVKSIDRFEIAKKIVESAERLGIPRKNIFIDTLTLTASAQQEDVFETLVALKTVKDILNVKTCLGVSNVSYGLPEREILTSVFLTSALTMGLDAPIMNPASEKSMEAIRAFKVIRNLDNDSENYINYYNKNKGATKEIVTPESKNIDLKQSIINAMKNEAESIAKNLLETKSGLEIINEYIAPALDIVGIKYEKGEIFLPQLLNSAETVQKIFELIKEKQQASSEVDSSKKILLATVQGDVHDIGKNIVKMLLENYGYNIIDLGKDVKINQVVETAIQKNISLVGLSALMTTTVQNMKKTIIALKAEIPDIKVMVGGAVLNEEYSKEIKADYYGKDALSAVAIAKDHFQKNQEV